MNDVQNENQKQGFTKSQLDFLPLRNDTKKMKTSNKFTLCRLICAPIFFILYFLPIWLGEKDGSVISIISFCAFTPLLVFAEITDYLDGRYARKYDEVSDFGKMFDPFADVFLHLSTFSCFVFSGYMPTILFVLILYREFSQNFLRMVAAKNGTAIAARKGGKLKTVFYVISCFVAVAVEGFTRTGLAAQALESGAVSENFLDGLVYVCYSFFGISALLSYVSFLDYLKNFGGILREASK